MRWKMQFTILLLAAFGWCPALQAQTSQEEEQLQQSWFPLKAGYSWTFRMEGEKQKLVWRVILQPESDPNSFILDAALGTRTLDAEVLQVREDGIYRTQVGLERISPGVPILLNEQTTWQSKFRLQRRENTFAATKEPAQIKVPAGTFETILVTSTVTDQNVKHELLTWYAKGTGPVKMVIRDGKKDLVLELERFRKIPVVPKPKPKARQPRTTPKN